MPTCKCCGKFITNSMYSTHTCQKGKYKIVQELEQKLLASQTEANDLRLELISADMHGTD